MFESDRRTFLKTTVAAASAMAVSSTVAAFAGESEGYAGVVYTATQQGQWQGKAGSHAPQVTVDAGKLKVVTAHPMTPEHFIVRHTVVLADGTVLGGTTFTATDKPESVVDLPADYKGKVCATSFCNKHDLWLTEVTV